MSMSFGRCLAALVLMISCLATIDAALQFAPVFADGMILQRGSGTKLWGVGASPHASVVLTLTDTAAPAGARQLNGTAVATVNGSWLVVMPSLVAAHDTRIEVSDGASRASLAGVAVGEVLLCSGQSNMCFAMCRAKCWKNVTAAAALAALAPVRFLMAFGDGFVSDKSLAAAEDGCNTSSGAPSYTPLGTWFTANATNAGGASALCMLTASTLAAHLGGGVPVGGVQACVGGTAIAAWTPQLGAMAADARVNVVVPATEAGVRVGADGVTSGRPHFKPGALWSAHVEPLVPMRFSAVLWDQGEANTGAPTVPPVKNANNATGSVYYAAAFPEMIRRWRAAFGGGGGPPLPPLPFVYVELPTEYNAHPPAQTMSFWLAQRAPVHELPAVGFATTTDIQRAMHPPAKQPVANRLLLALRRLALAEPVTSRGPELLNVSVGAVDAAAANTNVDLVATFSNRSLHVGAGTFVGQAAACKPGLPAYTTAFLQKKMGADGKVGLVGLNFTLGSGRATMQCDPSLGLVWLNADVAQCFLYGPVGLPAPPELLPCGRGGHFGRVAAQL